MAYHEGLKIFYKEFSPQSPADTFKTLLKGRLATRARNNNGALLRAGFNAPTSLAWGQLSGTREYLFTGAVPGVTVGTLIKGQALNGERLSLSLWRKLLRELGMFIGRLHATGFIHGDLRTSNILANKGLLRFEFSLINNEHNIYGKPAAGKQLLENLMLLNMHKLDELSRSDRLRFFHAWHSQMRDLSELEARIIAGQSFAWAMRRMGPYAEDITTFNYSFN